MKRIISAIFFVLLGSPLARAAAPAPALGDNPVTGEKPATLSMKLGRGVTFATEDDAFTVNLRARAQLQLLYRNTDDSAGVEPDVAQASIRRLRLLLQGNVYGPDLTYYVQLGFSNRDTEEDLPIPLRDAYANWGALRDLEVRVGQMKVPYGRQRVVSSSAQGMVDRSEVVRELNLDRDVGIVLHSEDLFGLGGILGYSLGLFGGDGRNRLSNTDGLLYVARLNLCPFGTFDDFVEADIQRDPRPRLAIGGGLAFNNQTNRPRSTTDLPYQEGVAFDYAHYGVDFTFKWRGFFATGEWMMRTSNPLYVTGVNAVGTTARFWAREAWGLYGQLGQMLTDSLELSARYGHLEPLPPTEPGLGMVQELGGGLSYYFEAHNLKVQADYFYLADNPDFAGGDHQLRLQSQLFF